MSQNKSAVGYPASILVYMPRLNIGKAIRRKEAAKYPRRELLNHFKADLSILLFQLGSDHRNTLMLGSLRECRVAGIPKR
jgi:hypothetical protein